MNIVMVDKVGRISWCQTKDSMLKKKKKRLCVYQLKAQESDNYEIKRWLYKSSCILGLSCGTQNLPLTYKSGGWVRENLSCLLKRERKKHLPKKGEVWDWGHWRQLPRPGKEPVKWQTVNILGFVGHMLSVKTAIDNTETNAHGCVPVKLYL